MSDTRPETTINRFSTPTPINKGEQADRSARAWREYRETGDPEALYKAGIWARP